MEEVWCDISDYKGLYQVSTCGKVKQVKGYIYKYLKEHENENN